MDGKEKYHYLHATKKIGCQVHDYHEGRDIFTRTNSVFFCFYQTNQHLYLLKIFKCESGKCKSEASNQLNGKEKDHILFKIEWCKDNCIFVDEYIKY